MPFTHTEVHCSNMLCSPKIPHHLQTISEYQKKKHILLLILAVKVYEPGSKLLVLGMVIQPLIGNPYNGHINPYYWVDDHPILYGNKEFRPDRTYSLIGSFSCIHVYPIPSGEFSTGIHWLHQPRRSLEREPTPTSTWRKLN